MNLRRILKDYEDSGALHAHVGIQSAVDDGVFLTRMAHVAAFARIHGVSYESLDVPENERASRCFRSSMNVFDEPFRFYQYLFKREASVNEPAVHSDAMVHNVLQNRSADLRLRKHYTLENYIAVVHEGAFGTGTKPSRFWSRETFSSPKMIESLAAGMDRAREQLLQKFMAFSAQLKDVAVVERLNDGQAFTFLRRLLNYERVAWEHANLKYKNFVDFQLCGSSLECHRDHLRLGSDYIKVLVLKDPSARTFAHMLRELLEVRCNLIIATEWKRESASAFRRMVASKRRHFHNLKTSLASQFSRSSGSSTDRLVDHGAVAVVDSLGDSLTEIEMNGVTFGQFSLTVVVYGPDLAELRHAIAACHKTFDISGAQVIEEDANLCNAWLALIPGNSALNVRRLWLSDVNYADLSLFYTLDTGNVRNEHLRAEYLAVLEGTGGVPYYLNLHCGHLAHTLVLGVPGSGKSFLVNFLLTHLQKYWPLTFVFDLGGSYRTFAQFFGGSYLSVNDEQRSFRINIFSLPPTPENLIFLLAFIRVLIESSDVRLSASDEQDLYQQIESLYAAPPEKRTLSTLAGILRENLRRPLEKWVKGGPYADLFDNVEDTLHFSRFQVFDFEGFDKAPDRLEPLLFYILHRSYAAICDERQAAMLKVFAMDEAWRFFKHPAVKAYIVEALKTWRRKEAALILATQSAADLIGSDMLPVVVENCPTKIFLRNSDMDTGVYRDAFHLNEREAEIIAELSPKGEMLLKQPDGSRRLTLNVDAKSYWLYTNNARDNARKSEAFARYSFQEGLERLAKETL